MTHTEALKLALDALGKWSSGRDMDAVELNDLIAELEAALEEPEQEPVLVVEQEPDYTSRGHFYEGNKPFIDPTKVWKLPIGTKLYTHPPRREWRGLTDEEAKDMAYAVDANGGSVIEFARAIEAALKEKNHK